MMRHHLHMPSYFLGTFTEYPFLFIPEPGMEVSFLFNVNLKANGKLRS